MSSTKSLDRADLLPLRVALLLLTCVRHVDAKLKFKDAESATLLERRVHLPREPVLLLGRDVFYGVLELFAVIIFYII